MALVTLQFRHVSLQIFKQAVRTCFCVCSVLMAIKRALGESALQILTASWKVFASWWKRYQFPSDSTLYSQRAVSDVWEDQWLVNNFCMSYASSNLKPSQILSIRRTLSRLHRPCSTLHPFLPPKMLRGKRATRRIFTSFCWKNSILRYFLTCTAGKCFE